MSQVGPSERDKQEVEKFRAAIVQAGIKLDPSRHDDRTLVRFLKARKYDPAKSLKMFAECEQWRQEFAVENVVQSFAYTESAAVDKVYPRFYHKTDREGRPVYIEVLATLDVKLLFAVTDQERVITRHVREYEKLMRYRLPACSARSGRPIDQGTTIIDLKGVPLSSFNQVRKIIQSLSAIAQNYYPETLGRMFIINAPTLFTAIWAVIKGMLDENTVAKISVLGSSYQKQLFEVVDPENLPESLGGKCKCAGGCDKADVGPWNDGSVAGYPIAFWEDFKKRDGC